MDQMFLCWLLNHQCIYGIWKWSLWKAIRFKWSLETRRSMMGLVSLFKEMRNKKFLFLSLVEDTEKRHLSASQKRDLIKNQICWNFYPRLPSLPNYGNFVYQSLGHFWLFVRPWTAALQASLSPWVCSNSCPLSQWCHSTILSSVSCFSSCPQSIPV